jgi:rubrerythrin
MAYARHSSNNRRGRNNNRGGNRNNNNGGNRRPQARLNHVYDSNGPEGRVRGTAAQIVEKYTMLARDANASGNKVLQQSFLQHAEHYQRVLIEVQKEIEQNNERRAEKQAEQAASGGNKNNNKGDSKATKDEPKAEKNPEDDKMTDVPGFLATETESEVKKQTKPRGRKPKAEKVSEKEVKPKTVEAEPV